MQHGQLYGPRDAACVLMAARRRVARLQGPDTAGRRWVLDGQAVTLAQLEDAAEQYERLRYQHTPRIK